jgi:hypothetical protein
VKQQSATTDLIIASLTAGIEVPCETFDAGLTEDTGEDMLETSVIAGEVVFEEES